jgi:hypothetical protein
MRVMALAFDKKLAELKRDELALYSQPADLHECFSWTRFDETVRRDLYEAFVKVGACSGPPDPHLRPRYRYHTPSGP